MLLESLLECVNEIRGRIDAHGAALRRSEAQTRYSLIDPLLRELGWDTDDPTLVVPEYQSGKVRADYALLSDGRPAMMVEAKSLDTPLQDVVRQGIRVLPGRGYPTLLGYRWQTLGGIQDAQACAHPREADSLIRPTGSVACEGVPAGVGTMETGSTVRLRCPRAVSSHSVPGGSIRTCIST